jgi:hypothetical protein
VQYALSPYIKQIRFGLKGLIYCNRMSTSFVFFKFRVVLEFFMEINSIISIRKVRHSGINLASQTQPIYLQLISLTSF